MNLVSRELADRLGLKLTRHSVPINGIINVWATESLHLCQLEIASTVGNYTNRIVCSVLPLITCSLPAPKISYEEWELPTDIPLADLHFYQPRAIELLIGATVFFEVLRPEQQFRQGHPTLQNTKLGWVLSGCIPAHSVGQRQTAKTSLVTTTHDLHAQVERFWL
jgi:hypothetical protein